MNVSVVILAAGKGSRMKSALPKVLQPFAGKPILEHIVDASLSLNPSKVVIVYGHQGELVKSSISSEVDTLDWVEQVHQLGTGDAVKCALPKIDKSNKAVTLVLVGDVPLIKSETLSSLVRACDGERLAVLTTDINNPKGYGRIVKDSDGDVVKIVEEKDASDEEKRITEINTGILAIPSRNIENWVSQLKDDNAQNEFYLTDLVAIANNEGHQVVSLCIDNEVEVSGINDKSQLEALERAYQLEQVKRLFDQGVTIIDKHRVDIRGSVEVGMDVFIDVNVLFKGTVKLGNNVRIDPNCIIENSDIGDNTWIRANSMIENSQIENDCEVGPFARVRPDSLIKQSAKIGNFVEVKKSTLGVGSKVNHLSYIGDALIGDNVNIGAGTITCNYDGYKKSTTVIEDGAFIGSNSSLVAPVKIGQNSVVGAGSAITKEVGSGNLGLARAKQSNIPNWSSKKKDS